MRGRVGSSARAAAAVVALVLATPAAAQPEAGTYVLLDGRSSARLTAGGPIGEVAATLPAEGDIVVGRGGRVTGGTIVFDAAALEASDFAAQQLRGPEGFDVARHRTARFAVAGGRFDGDTLRLEGTLTVRGRSRSVALGGEVVRARGKRFTAVLTTRIDRTEFGIVAGRPLYAARSEVRLRLVAARHR